MARAQSGPNMPPTPVETKVCYGSGARIGGKAAMGLGKVDGLLAREGEEGKPPCR